VRPGSGEDIPVRSEVPPPPEKLQRTSKAPTQLYCPLRLIFGISFDVFPIGTARRFNCSQPPDVDVPTMDCRTNVCRNRVCRNSVVYPIPAPCGTSASAQTVNFWGHHLQCYWVRIDYCNSLFSGAHAAVIDKLQVAQNVHPQHRVTGMDEAAEQSVKCCAMWRGCLYRGSEWEGWEKKV